MIPIWRRSALEVIPRLSISQSNVRSTWNRGELEVRLKSDRSETKVKSKWNAVSTKRYQSHKLAVNSKWDPIIKLKSKSEHRKSDVGSKWNRTESEVKTTWSQSLVEVKPKCDRSETERLSSYQNIECKTWHIIEFQVAKSNWTRSDIDVSSKLIEVRLKRSRGDIDVASTWSRPLTNVGSKRVHA